MTLALGPALGTVAFDRADPQRLASFWAAALKTSIAGEFVAVSYDQVDVVPDFDWTTLTDPEGNEFRVAEHRGG